MSLDHSTNLEVVKWYDRHHSKNGNASWRPYRAYPRFLKYLKAKHGRNLLDVGCGTGFLLKAGVNAGLVTYGIDISSEAIRLAKQNSPLSTIMVCNGESINYPDGVFDYLTCIGALEHFLNIPLGIMEMIRVLKDDGRICVVVPNINFIWWKLRGRKGTAQQEINEHLYSLKQWRDFFEGYGLRVLKIKQDTWKLRGLRLPLNHTYQFVFVMEKAT